MKTFKFWAFLTVSFFMMMGCGKEPPQPPAEYLRPAAGQTAPGHATKTGTTAEGTATARMKAPRQGAQSCVGGPCPPIGPTGSALTMDEDGVPILGITETSKVIPTTPASGVEHGVRQVTTAARYGTAWVLLALGILIPGPLVILLIPGFITGRAEKVLEGLALGAWGLFMLALCSDAGVSSLSPWVWGVLVVPGGLLLVWGLLSDNEAGKFVLVVGPVIVFALYLFAQVYRMLVLGAAGSAIFTFLILLLVGAILFGAVSRLGGKGS